MAYKIKVAAKPVTDQQIALHWLDRWVLWETRHRRILWPVVIGTVLLVLSVGGGGGWWWWQNHQAALLAGRAAELYPVPPEAASPNTENQQKPAAAAACAKALPLYQEITDRYSHSRLAPLARYYQANCQNELGKLDDAVALYTQSITEYGLTQESAQLAALRLGYLYAGRGEQAKALEQFQRLAAQATAFNRDQALFEAGRLQEADNKEAALNAYRTIQKDFPKSPWSSEAAVRIKALGGEPSAPPAAALPPAVTAPTGTPPAPPQTNPAAPSSGGR